MKKGFTLSETLITLAIMGVLAALLIPSLMNSTPDKNRVMFKKAYYSTENAVSQMINDDTNYPEMMSCSLSGVSVNCGFNNSTTNALIPAGQNKFCYLFSQEVNTVGAATCTSGSSGTFKTTDGVSWTITDTVPTVADAYDLKIIIDANGSSNQPNCTQDTGTLPAGVSKCASASTSPDTFIIGVRYDGKLQVGTTDTVASSILSDPTNNKK